MLGKERLQEGTCCLSVSVCHHVKNTSLCCKVSKCRHGNSGFKTSDNIKLSDVDECLPAPPPRGRSSVDTVQALKLRIGTGGGIMSPELGRKRLGRRSEGSVPCRPPISSRDNGSSSRDSVVSRDSAAALPSNSAPRDSVVSRDAVAALPSSSASRDSVVSRDSAAALPSNSASRDRILPRACAVSCDQDSPNISVRSEGSGTSLQFTAEDKPISTPVSLNGHRPSLINSKDSTRTPIGRTSGKRFVSLNDLPRTSDNDIGFLKEEFISRLIKEKEELLELRKRKESQREKLLQFRQEQYAKECKELDVTPTPIPHLPDRQVVLETPQKYGDISPDTSPAAIASPSPRPHVLHNLKSDAAIAFQRRISDTPTSSGLLCRNLRNMEEEGEEAAGTTPTDLLATPTPKPVLSRNQEHQTPTKVTPEIVHQRASSTPYKQPSHHNPTMSSQPDLRNFSPSHSFKFSGDLGELREGGESHPREPLRASQSLPVSHSAPSEDTSSPSIENSVSDPAPASPSPDSTTSPFNERAVDCPVMPKFPSSNSYHSNGGGGGVKKLSPHGFDVVRSLGRDVTPADMEQAVNPALLQPFRRRSRKSKEGKEKEHRCNTQ